jgi:hypothetical protein
MNPRNIMTVIAQIQALLPNPAPPEVSDEITTLAAELNILERTAAYTPSESAGNADLWGRLGTALYRYLPNPARYPWAQAISTLVLA